VFVRGPLTDAVPGSGGVNECAPFVRSVTVNASVLSRLIRADENGGAAPAERVQAAAIEITRPAATTAHPTRRYAATERSLLVLIADRFDRRVPTPA